MLGLGAKVNRPCITAPPHTHTQQTYQRVTASPSVSWKMAQLHSEGHGLGYMSLFEFQVQHL